MCDVTEITVHALLKGMCAMLKRLILYGLLANNRCSGEAGQWGRYGRRTQEILSWGRISEIIVRIITEQLLPIYSSCRPGTPMENFFFRNSKTAKSSLKFASFLIWEDLSPGWNFGELFCNLQVQKKQNKLFLRFLTNYVNIAGPIVKTGSGAEAVNMRSSVSYTAWYHWITL